MEYEDSLESWDTNPSERINMRQNFMSGAFSVDRLRRSLFMRYV